MSGSQEHPDSPEPGRHGLPELIAERRAKAQRLLQSDASSFPYSFAGAEPIERIHERYAQLADGEETEDAHRVAGRIAARRGAGRAAFLDLVDRSGKIQLHARLDVLGREAFDRLTSLDLGDLIGVDGAVLRSRHGELSLRVDVAPKGTLDPRWRELLARHSGRFMVGTDTWTVGGTFTGNERWDAYADIVTGIRAWLAQLPTDVAEAIAYRNAERFLAQLPR